MSRKVIEIVGTSATLSAVIARLEYIAKQYTPPALDIQLVPIVAALNQVRGDWREIEYQALRKQQEEAHIRARLSLRR